MAHARCPDPQLPWRHRDQTRRSLHVSDATYTPPRAPSHQCLLCGKAFQRGDRLVLVLRSLGNALDPLDGVAATRCADDYEVAHKDCADPQLLGGQAPLIVSVS